LREHFLHWLEALSLIGKASDSVQMVTSLQSLVVSGLMGLSYQFNTDISGFLRVMQTLFCTKWSTMQQDSFFITDQSSKRHLFKYITLLSSSRRR
jgi:hypothetical protein